MHDVDYTDFYLKIIKVRKVELQGKTVKAVVTTSHFGRVTTRPYEFTLAEWGKIVERGWIE